MALHDALVPRAEVAVGALEAVHDARLVVVHVDVVVHARLLRERLAAVLARERALARVLPLMIVQAGRRREHCRPIH